MRAIRDSPRTARRALRGPPVVHPAHPAAPRGVRCRHVTWRRALATACCASMPRARSSSEHGLLSQQAPQAHSLNSTKSQGAEKRRTNRFFFFGFLFRCGLYSLTRSVLQHCSTLKNALVSAQLSSSLSLSLSCSFAVSLSRTMLAISLCAVPAPPAARRPRKPRSRHHAHCHPWRPRGRRSGERVERFIRRQRRRRGRLSCR